MDFHKLLKELDGLVAQGAVDLDPEQSAAIAAMAIEKSAQGKHLSSIERDAIKGYAELFQELLRNPTYRRRLEYMRDLIKNSKKDSEKS